MPGTPTPNHGIPTMAGASDAGSTIDDTYNAGVTVIDGKLTKVFEWPLNDRIAGVIDHTDIVPVVFVPVKAGTTVRLIRIRCKIASGTSVTFTVKRNGVDIAGLVSTVATTAAADDTPTTPPTLANNDELQIDPTAVSGSPIGLTVTYVLEITV